MRRDKGKQLEKLQRECREFFKKIFGYQEKILVFGEGNPDSNLVLVGEAPGKQETLQQRPFVGQAGKNLEEFLSIVGLQRQDIYITNVVKFRPVRINEDTGRTSNRPPNKEEIGLCTGWLYRELEIIQPRVVVSLGNIALRVLAVDKRLNIGAVHGRPIDIEVGESNYKTVLFPLYHPASVIYRRDLKSTYLNDLEKLKEFLKTYK